MVTTDMCLNLLLNRAKIEIPRLTKLPNLVDESKWLGVMFCPL